MYSKIDRMDRFTSARGVTAVGRLIAWSAAARGRTLGLIALSLAATGAIDYATGHRFMFSPLYLFPVLLASVAYGRAAGLAVVAMAATVWAVSQLPPGAAKFPWAPLAWNVLMHSAVLGSVGWLLTALEEEMVASRQDYLTRLFNRRYFMQSLESERSRSLRSGRPFSVLSVDLDRFKALNDTLGHAAGDEALRVVARILTAGARAVDVSARMGGDEFCVLLTEADAGIAAEIARRLQAAATAEFSRCGWSLGLSIGVVTSRGVAETIEQLLDRADEAMYLEKRARRDRPISAEEPEK